MQLTDVFLRVNFRMISAISAAPVVLVKLGLGVIFAGFFEFCIQLVLFDKSNGIFTSVKRLRKRLVRMINFAMGLSINVSWFSFKKLSYLED